MFAPSIRSWRATETRRCCAPSWIAPSRRRSASLTSRVGTRCRPPLAGVGVRQRLPDEVRKVAQPLETTGAAGPTWSPPPAPPQSARHPDGRRQRGTVSGASHRLSQPPACLVVALHPVGSAGAQHLARTVSPSSSTDVRTGKRSLPFSLQPPTTVAVCASRYRTTVAAGSPSSRPTSLRHLLEHAARRRLRGDERGYSSAGPQLIGQRALGRLAGRQRLGRPGALGGHRPRGRAK